LWRAAQRKGTRKLAPARSLASEILRTGSARCAACRYSLQATTTSRRRRIYRCTRIHAGGSCPAPARVGAERLERLVVAAFWALTDDLEAEGNRDNADELAGREKAVQRAERALEQWASTEVQEAIGDLAEYAAGLRERRGARDAAIEELDRERAAASAAGLPNAETLRGAWG